MGGMALHPKGSAEPRIRVRALPGHVNIRRLRPLLADISRELSGACTEWGPEDTVVCHHEIRFAALLNEPACNVVLASQASRPTGIAVWRALPWDSRQYGFPAASIDLLVPHGRYRESRDAQSALLRKILRDAAAVHMRHVMARVDTGKLASIHALEDCGFETIDGIQIASPAWRRGCSARRIWPRFSRSRAGRTFSTAFTPTRRSGASRRMPFTKSGSAMPAWARRRTR